MPNIQTPYDIGQIIKSRRKQLGWDQAQLADKIGVSRQWIINIEQGKPRAEIGLILRALHALELPVFIGQINTDSTSKNMPDFDIVLEDTKNEQAKHALALKVPAERLNDFLAIQNKIDATPSLIKILANHESIMSSESLIEAWAAQTNLVYPESFKNLVYAQENLVPSSEELKKVPPAQRKKEKIKK